jgi:hypothetical protein
LYAVCAFCLTVMATNYSTETWAAAGGSGAAAAPLQFRHDNSDLVSRGFIAASFVLLVAVGAAVGVYVVRRRLPMNRFDTPGAEVRVAQVRRVSKQLSIVTVVVDGSQTVVFADNGHALLQLASIPRSSTAATGKEQC